ncbi:MAG: leucyl aminopeptidase [Deltaproteobacteria bacterium]|nr:leucyl aminopeptidase [Candidatus Zymogenaceae bacterium]
MKDDLSPRLPSVAVSGGPLSAVKTPVLVVGLFEGTGDLAPEVAALDKAVDGKIRAVLGSGDFTGKPDETSLLYVGAAGGPERICLVGLGKKKGFSSDRLKAAAAAAARHLKGLGIHTIALAHDLAAGSGIPGPTAAREVFVGAALGAYSFSSLKKADDKKRTVDRIVICGDPSALADGPRHGRIIADSVYLARDLANTPANLMTPTILAARAVDVAEKCGLSIEVLDRRKIQRLGMGAFLGVARGSAEPPALIVIKYLPPGHKKSPVALVGKGITFDSGGISLKPVENMGAMKTDMSGGAAVLSAVAAAARMKLPIGIIAVIPATENMPGPGATKPGDVLVAMDKTTIEVITTDAEGRLVLADGIAYAKRFEPALILDIATLTGSAVIALGKRVAALFASGDDLLERIRQASRASGEQVWPMPLFDHYFEQTKGEVADLRNATGRDGGSITAAAFLKRFAGDTIPWAHLDIAGTARSNKDYGWVTKGATGWGVMTLVEFLQGCDPPKG